jgi:ring-1,2-phenylacetyl-CoA epoxidase subunit PaaD
MATDVTPAQASSAELTAQHITEALHTVKDPEIPTISVVDMGIITGVHVAGDDVRVSMTPTFVGCPAIEVMRNDVESVVRGLGYTSVHVDVNFDEAWSTNRITEKGRAALLKHGLAPPQPFENTLTLQLEVLDNVACPVCGSRNTDLRSPFGPTLCRSIHHCNNCGETFEAFKPV